MSEGPPQLLALEAPLGRQRTTTTFRLLEPHDSSRDSLLDRLFQGTYDKPFIVDRGARRFLHFDLFNVQSAMNLQYPDRLSLAYTRKMMAFLLFDPAPSRILLLGLGGGSLAKFCYRRLPEAAITAVEVNSDVIALREEFRIPADNQRFRVVCADGAKYLAGLERPVDVILADACDRVGVVPECETLEFYQQVYHCLARGGVFVANLCADVYGAATHIEKISVVFGNNCVTLRVKQHGNLIVFAFKDPRSEIHWSRLEAGAIDLKKRFGLDFPRYVRRAHLQNVERHQGP